MRSADASGGLAHAAANGRRSEAARGAGDGMVEQAVEMLFPVELDQFMTVVRSIEDVWLTSSSDRPRRRRTAASWP